MDDDFRITQRTPTEVSLMATLVWQRAPQSGDEYALTLVNPEDVDAVRLNKLLSKVKHTKGGLHHGLSTQAIQAFEQWLRDPSKPLPSHMYARLSNWFLTGSGEDKESVLAGRCADLWDALFSARPGKRLTPADDNGEIIDIAFETWWKRQTTSQGDR